MNYTFIELQKQYKIIIPQIQRDYAQGREDKDNENKIKSYDFILKIIDVLTTNIPSLNLDFIYGYTKTIGKDKIAFIPLDGQQRLTTLWLLHWYLSPKVEIEKNGIKMLSVSDEVKTYLNNFTYETRNSSKRFCEELIDEWLPVSNDIRSAITDAHWFMSSWLNDPTVVSMLNMLDTIQKQNFDKEKALKNLFENRKITFDYIDIKADEFKLTDELYIKMNSRGKPLTSFDDFKAQFSEILSAKDTEYFNEKIDYEGTKVTFQEYFAFKIDSVWTDLFWNFVVQEGYEEKIRIVMKDKRINKDESPISYCFMCFFIYIAQMCFFKDNVNKNASDFKNDFSVFKKKDNAKFLFDVLDWFYKISIDKQNQVCIDKIGSFFENLFQKDETNNTYQGHIRLFEEGVNLFEKCLLEGGQFDNRNRIILFCLLSYSIKYQSDDDIDGLRCYIRVIRNLLQATRQRNEIVYNTNVRINSFGSYWKLFEQLLEKTNVYERLLDNLDNKGTEISDDALSNEKEKAQIIVDNTSSKKIIQALFKLEEFKYFSGLIHNLNPKENIDNLIIWSECIQEILSCDDYLIVASLIACDFGGFYIKDCRLGEMWFFGKGDNWSTILAGQSKIDENLSKPIILLLTKYKEKKLLASTLTPKEILEIIIKEFINSLNDKNWQYYFCKYREHFLSDKNYYSWINDFENEILGSTSYNPLLAYHINPYVKTVSKLLDNSICQENRCYDRYSDESCLRLNNGFHLYSKQDGWHIMIPEGQTLSGELRKVYNINKQNIFSETGEKDRIEIAVNFCKSLSAPITPR